MVGGIHTVLATKASAMMDRYGERYFTVGPDIARVDEDRKEFRDEIWMPELLESIAPLGLSVRMGRWLVPGEPRCLLLNYSDLYGQKDAILSHYWETYRLDSLFGGWDYYDPLLFAHGVGLLIEHFYVNYLYPERLSAAVQCHEWMSGAAILHLREKAPEIGAVFTTHATTIGRALAAKQRDPTELFDAPKDRLADVARDLGVQSKYSMEQVATNTADVFTTVSDITALECEHLLGRKPDVVLPNGLSDSFPSPSLATPEAAARAREALFSIAELATGDRYDRATTRIVISGGRYEYENKGIDVFLDALGELRKDLNGPAPRVVAFGLFAGGHAGPRRDLLRARREGVRPHNAPFLSTHELLDEKNDPILKRLAELAFTNAKGEAVHVLEVPIYLDGTDALIPETYYELLPGADATVFPSLYEPWGYTPLESAALGVPTFTSDLAGFGRWAAARGGFLDTGVSVLHRRGRTHEETVRELREHLVPLLRSEDGALVRLRQMAKALAQEASWRVFAQKYFEAHDGACEKAGRRAAELPPRRFVEIAKRRVVASVSGGDVLAHMRSFTVVNPLREKLSPLHDVARNVSWTWHPEGGRLFEDLSPALWSAVGNDPALLLDRLPRDAVARAESSPEYLGRLDRVHRAVLEEAKKNPHPDIAYFCMEHGLVPFLRIYSGGLGILAGDHLKTVSDLGLPLVAVGLAYQFGYFRQVIAQDGSQEAHPELIDFRSVPFEPVLDASGAPIVVSVAFPRGPVHVRAWRVRVGSAEVLLLDTNHEGNRPQVRAITDRLYPSDPAARLAQEVVLGIGGFQLLRAAGLDPRVYHMNEGHSAFLVVARIAHLMQTEDLRYEEALEFVRHTTVFTTHTPVPAGHDYFPEALVRPYLSPFERIFKKDWEAILSLGRKSGSSEFSTTALAMRGSLRVNGVSDRHRRVTQEMFQDLYPGLHVLEVPIKGITNGVHVPTWVAPEWQRVFAEEVGPDWRERLTDVPAWDKIRATDPRKIWSTHHALKQKLLAWLRDHVRETWLRRRENPRLLALALERLDEDPLIIGFARRFAPYKRATLLFRDVQRLAALLGGERPAVVLFAGKAHPSDGAGKDLVKQIVEAGRDERLAGRVLFVENYDIGIAQRLVSGSDVWLNTPTRPLEASGTSGMKAAMNGCPNLSVGDGWWLEGYNGKNGWLIGAESSDAQPGFQDEYDSAMLYAILEHEVLPAYFDRGPDGVPAQWVDVMKESIASLVPRFSSRRMLEQYRDLFYVPARRDSVELSKGAFERLSELVERQKRLVASWGGVGFVDARVDGLDHDQVDLGAPIKVELELRHPGLLPDDVDVQAVVTDAPAHGELASFVTHPLACASFDAGTSTSRWRAEFSCDVTGPHALGIRALPRSLLEGDPPAAELDMVRWL